MTTQKNKRALVCGASQGIGEATARALALAGHSVILLARNGDKLEKVRASLPGSGHQILAGDLEDLIWLESAVKKELQNGSITILLNNSGGPKTGALLEAKAEDFLAALSSHVLASQKLVQLLAPSMQAEKFGRIVNLISTSVKVPIPNLGVSNTIRGAMANWSKTLAYELGPFGITVNNVLPGFTKTERLKTLVKNSAEKLNLSDDEIEKQWKATIPARRFAEAVEIADAIVFLCSEKASYINGINLPVDGGRTPNL